MKSPTMPWPSWALNEAVGTPNASDSPRRALWVPAEGLRLGGLAGFRPVSETASDGLGSGRRVFGVWGPVSGPVRPPGWPRPVVLVALGVWVWVAVGWPPSSARVELGCAGGSPLSFVPSFLPSLAAVGFWSPAPPAAWLASPRGSGRLWGLGLGCCGLAALVRAGGARLCWRLPALFRDLP